MNNDEFQLNTTNFPTQSLLGRSETLHIHDRGKSTNYARFKSYFKLIQNIDHDTSLLRTVTIKSEISTDANDFCAFVRLLHEYKDKFLFRDISFIINQFTAEEIIAHERISGFKCQDDYKMSWIDEENQEGSDHEFGDDDTFGEL